MNPSAKACIDALRLALVLCLALALTACGSSGRKTGGYYKDDGPGGDIPANIARIPDAVPRVEPLARANMRPYAVFGRQYRPIADSRPFRQTGVASWYGRKFHGNRTANGERYDMYAMTAAHPTLPLPSYARVTRPSNGRSIIVRINDRGPFHSNRIIDLSYAAAAKLGLIGPGSGQVIVEAITHSDIQRQAWQRPGEGTAVAAKPPPAPVRPDLGPSLALLTADAAAPASPEPLVAPHLEVEPAEIAALPNALDILRDSPAAPDTGAAPGTSATRHASGADPPALFLQFGAFSVRDTAETLTQQLNQALRGIEPRHAAVQSDDALHRVRIGPYPDRTSAVNAALRIQQATGRQGVIAPGRVQQ